MKKRISVILLILLMPILLGCHKAPPPETTEDIQIDKPLQYKHICVDISDGEGGFYTLMADTKLEYYKNELTNIFIEDPTVLAFKVPEHYTNGVGIVDGKNILEIQKKINERLNATDIDKSTKELLDYILQEIEKISILTSAST